MNYLAWARKICVGRAAVRAVADCRQFAGEG